MINLKPLKTEAISAALEKAKRYRLLNEPDDAESICLDILANQLLEREVLVKSDVERLVGKRPFPDKEEFKPLMERNTKYKELFEEEEESNEGKKAEDEEVMS